MWSPRPLLRNTVIALSLFGATGLAGCSGLTPVYGERGIGAERVALRYDAPQNRLDQIIYQELILRLGQTSDPSAPKLRLTTTRAARDLTKSAASRPSEQSEAVVTATIVLIGPDDKVLFSTTRSAAALYSTDRQALASSEAQIEAYERAARELAETVRLTLLGALTNLTAG